MSIDKEYGPVQFAVISASTSADVVAAVGGKAIRVLPVVLIALISGFIVYQEVEAARYYYVATDGSDANDGSFSSPFATITHASGVAHPGDTIYLRGGTYNLSERVEIQTSGARNQRIRLWAYPGETPILDFTSFRDPQRLGESVFLNGDWWHLKGLIIQNAPVSIGLRVRRSNNIIERCTARWNGNTGISIRGASGLGVFSSNNLILNCDSYENYHAASHGQAGDGFGCAQDSQRPGNVFRGCCAWRNADDGYDFLDNPHSVLVEDCWAYKNGINLWKDPEFAGNGNGFKLGPGPGIHVVRRCLAWANRRWGITDNSNANGLTLYDCTCWNNGIDYPGSNPGSEAGNYRMVYSRDHTLRNNISLAPVRQDLIHTDADASYNSFSNRELAIDGAVAKWTFDSFLTADTVGSNMLTNTGGVTSVSGQIGNAAHFDKSQQQSLTMASNTDLQMGNFDFTVACWVKLDSKAERVQFVGKGNGFTTTPANIEYALVYHQSANRFQFVISNGTSIESVSASYMFNTLGLDIELDTWYFLEGYYDKDRGKIGIRVNGEWTNEANWSTGAHAGSNALRIGTSTGSADWLDGTLDEVGIWKSLPGLQNTATEEDFLSLDSSIAEGPRQSDGSLPVSDFLRLAPGSQFIDAGVGMGLPFDGDAPDLGAFERDD